MKMKKTDPAYWMLHNGITSTPTVHNDNCYICNDSEYAQMGLPLCFPCHFCKAHVQADGDMCCDNGHPQPEGPDDPRPLDYYDNCTCPTEVSAGIMDGPLCPVCSLDRKGNGEEEYPF